MIINCRCGTPLEVDEDMFGEEIQCPRCRTTMVAPTHPDQPGQRSEFTPAPQPSSQQLFPPPSWPASTPQPGPANTSQAAPGTTSANAIACLNMGINSFIVPFVLAIPSILFGLMALRDCRKYRMQGKSMAVMGITLSVFSTLCLSIILYMLFPTIKQAYQLVKGLGKDGGLAGDLLGKGGAGGIDILGQLTDPKVKAESLAMALQKYQNEKGTFPSPNLAKRNGQPGQLELACRHVAVFERRELFCQGPAAHRLGPGLERAGQLHSQRENAADFHAGVTR